MQTRNQRKLMERINLVRRMNRTEALNRLDNIWRHGTTSLFELKAVMNRIKDS